MTVPDVSEGAIRRVRRPKDKDELVERLRSRDGGAFAEIRDVLLFAAVVGFQEQRYEPLGDDNEGESIRWETFINRWFAEDLIGMIAVAHSEDKEIASRDRIGDQLRIFEAYANGGLMVLEEKLERLKLDEPIEGVLEVLQSDRGAATGVDVLIKLAEEPDF